MVVSQRLHTIGCNYFAINPFIELIDFVVANIKPELISAFRASEESPNYAYDLLQKEKTGVATTEERDELDQFMQLEHTIRMMKAKARELGTQDQSDD